MFYFGNLFAAQSVQYILWEIAIQDAVELCEQFNNFYIDGNVIVYLQLYQQ